MTDRTINGLLIEDDPDDTLFLMNLMAKPDWPAFKFVFVCAEDLKSGLRLLSKGGIEVILLDLMLPDSQGIETVLKVYAQAPDVPIVVLTGVDDQALGLQAVMRGAQDYQVKGSINEHALKRTVGFAVERHRLLTRLQNIIASIPDGIVIMDPAAKTVRCVNPAAEALIGRDAKALLGQTFPHPLPNARFGEFKISARDGRERTLETRAAEIEWEDAPASLIAIRDVTDLRQIEQLKADILERQKLEKLKEDLVSAISHAMRNPLTIIKAAGSNLKEGLAGHLSAQQTEMVSLQYKNILRLEKIVDRILDLSRLESGRAQVNLQRVDGAHLIRDTLREFGLVAGERNLLIQQEIPSDLPAICADPELFIQLLSNLIDNAMRFTETRILIRAGGAEDANVAAPAGRQYVQISVIDDGQGLPQERLGDLFNKFVQISRSNKGESYRGTGLGLALCKEIVELHKGRIWAESALGQGARFHFTLPRYEYASARGL